MQVGEKPHLKNEASFVEKNQKEKCFVFISTEHSAEGDEMERL